MKKITSLFAVLVLAATVAVVPAANAQVVHYLGAGSSAMFQGFDVAAYNDLANKAGSTVQLRCSTGGYTCVASHWSVGSAVAKAFVQDNRAGVGVIPNEPGNIWIVWITCTAGANPCPAGTGGNGTSDIWAYVSLDSVVGTREFLGRDAANKPATLNLPGPFGAGANKVAGCPNNIFNDSSCDTLVAPPADVIAALNGHVVTAGMTDVRPEDGLQATLRILGNCPDDANLGPGLQTGCNYAGAAGEVPEGGLSTGLNNPCPLADTGIPSGNPVPCNNFPYYEAYTLAYSKTPVWNPFPYPGAATGTPSTGQAILESAGTNTANPVSFGLPGSNDPFTGKPVPATITTYAVGESPIILIANRSNATGLGQIIGGIPACNGLDNHTDNAWCVRNQPGLAAYVSDGSYAVRNMWDQHPYPPVAGVFPNKNKNNYVNPGAGYCENAANTGTGACHINSHLLGSLFSGNLIETQNPVFTWPWDGATQGGRPNLQGGFQIAPINVVLREPLSGTYNTFEYTLVRSFGSNHGNFSWNGANWENTPYYSQEDDVAGSVWTPLGAGGAVVFNGAPYNPLNLQAPLGFGDAGPEGFRVRRITTGDVVSYVLNPVANGAATSDAIGYLFFSFGNVNSIKSNASFGYLMIDDIDPLFDNYENAALSNHAATNVEGEGVPVAFGGPGGVLSIANPNPGQPAVFNQPLTWGELPSCGLGCTTTTIWGANPSYPHLRDGLYPAWSELRMLCDTLDPNCLATMDPYGAEALVYNLQQDIHFANVGGVPDLLPFDDAGAWHGPYGDVSFIRDHSATEPAGFVPPGGGPATTSVFRSFSLADDYQDLFGGLAFSSPVTTHQTIPAEVTTCAGGVGTDAPPNAECGGDVGGYVIPAPAGALAATGQQQ